MANKVEGKLSINIDEYEKGIKKASKTTEDENKKIDKSFDKTSDNIEEESSKIQKNNNDIAKSGVKLSKEIDASSADIVKNYSNMSDKSDAISENIIQDADKIKEANIKMKDGVADTADGISKSSDSIKNSFDNIEKEAQDTGGKVKKSFTEMAEEVKDAFEGVKEVGDTLTKSITLPMAGAVGAVGAVGFAYEECENIIRIGTGAIGENLQGLIKEFEEVDKKVPASTKDVATAIADINTKLGLTEKPLNEYATQMINLSKITGEDLASGIDKSSKMFNNWNIEAKDYGKTMDFVFKVSQSTGSSTQYLMENVTGLSATLKEAGYSLEESISLVGQLDKAGIGASEMTSGMDKAFMKLKNEGCTDLKKGLDGIFKSIKEAKTETEANTIAMEYFGKSGIKMATSIKDGRLEIDEFTKSINENGETINGLEEETRTFGDELKIMMKEIKEAFKPIGEDLIKILDEVKPYIMNIVDSIVKLVEWFSNLSPEAKAVIAVIGGIVMAIGPLLSFLGSLGMAFMGLQVIIAGSIIPAIGSMIGAFIGFIAPALPVIAIITAIIAVGVLLYKNWETIQEFAGLVWENVKEIFTSMAEGIGQIFADIWNIICQCFDNIYIFLAGIGGTILEVILFPFKASFNILQTIFEGIKEHIRLSLDFIKALFSGDFGRCGEIIRDIFGNIKDTVKNVFKSVIDTVKNSIEKVKSFFKFEWELPKIKLPHFNWTGSFSLSPLQVPKMDITWKSKGGIFTKPTVLGNIGVGDKHNGIGSNAEAVLPIDRLPELLGLNGDNGGFKLEIGTFVNNTEQDVPQLMKEMYHLKKVRGIK